MGLLGEMINKITTLEQAQTKLEENYEEVTGEKPDDTAQMICKMSATRVLAGEDWEWSMDEANSNWGAKLIFK